MARQVDRCRPDGDRGWDEPATAMSDFIYAKSRPRQVLIEVRLPRGLTTKTALLSAVSSALRFPDYFGGNWDAFEECIRDLSWLPDGDVAIVHEDVPFNDSSHEHATYVAILRDAVARWQSSGERRLFVVFPPGAEVKIQGAGSESV